MPAHPFVVLTQWRAHRCGTRGLPWQLDGHALDVRDCARLDLDLRAHCGARRGPLLILELEARDFSAVQCVRSSLCQAVLPVQLDDECGPQHTQPLHSSPRCRRAGRRLGIHRWRDRTPDRQRSRRTLAHLECPPHTARQLRWPRHRRRRDRRRRERTRLLSASRLLPHLPAPRARARGAPSWAPAARRAARCAALPQGTAYALHPSLRRTELARRAPISAAPVHRPVRPGRIWPDLASSTDLAIWAELAAAPHLGARDAREGPPHRRSRRARLWLPAAPATQRRRRRRRRAGGRRRRRRRRRRWTVQRRHSCRGAFECGLPDDAFGQAAGPPAPAPPPARHHRGLRTRRGRPTCAHLCQLCTLAAASEPANGGSSWARARKRHQGASGRVTCVADQRAAARACSLLPHLGRGGQSSPSARVPLLHLPLHAPAARLPARPAADDLPQAGGGGFHARTVRQSAAVQAPVRPRRLRHRTRRLRAPRGLPQHGRQACVCGPQ